MDIYELTEDQLDPKFTPAPWHYAMSGDSFVSKDGRQLCKRPSKSECTYEQWLQNASLIAKAPELYDFLLANVHWLPDDKHDEALVLLAHCRGHHVTL